jgi:NAD-dependent SIR2 family protein deacetylase
MVFQPSAPENPMHTSFPEKCIEIDVTPLVRSIAEGNAVAFVGAGASISAGLPSWLTFLKNCLRRAINSSHRPDTWTFAADLLRNGDYLTAAELLQRGIGSQLEEYIWDEFGMATQPSPIHEAVARIPFSAAITTNYDRLLESAYEDTPPVRTWLDSAAIFSAIRNRRFCVIKTHGDVGNRPSLVLTKTEYRDLVQKNEAFNSCLRMLLSLRTFLFIGYSLRDHDLLGLMDAARLMHGEDFGPHYAILFREEVDEKFLEFLRESYAIHTIVIEKPPSDAPVPMSYLTTRVVEVLRELGGRVSLRQLEIRDTTFPASESTFTFRNEANRFLRRAISLTGSFRGEVCVIRDEHLHSMERFALHPLPPDCCGEHELKRHAVRVGEKIPNDSVVGRVFLTWKSKDDFAHISNVCKAEKQLSDQGFAGAVYRRWHPDVQSQLACPILADGQRIGVLNLESNRVDSYTLDHLHVATSIASQVGVAYTRLKQREFATRQLSHFHGDFSRFNRVMRVSRLLSHFDMQFILYSIDYRNGELIAHFDEERIAKNTDSQSKPKSIDLGFRWGFDAKSLASLAFRDRKRILIEDAQQEIQKGTDSRVAGTGLKVFGIRGPLVSMPITVRGHVAGVLVAWSDRPEILQPGQFASISERVSRMAQLIANDPKAGSWSGSGPVPSEELVEFINRGFYQFDSGKLWTPKVLKRRAFRAGVLGVALSSLVQPSIGLTRVRLWTGREEAYAISASVCRPDSVCGRKKPVNGYVKVSCGSDDPYVAYTAARYANDSHARHQHQSMFDGPDRNQTVLDKAPDGNWIVAPIVRRRWLKGYLSVAWVRFG